MSLSIRCSPCSNVILVVLFLGMYKILVIFVIDVWLYVFYVDFAWDSLISISTVVVDYIRPKNAFRISSGSINKLSKRSSQSMNTEIVIYLGHSVLLLSLAVLRNKNLYSSLRWAIQDTQNALIVILWYLLPTSASS